MIPPAEYTPDLELHDRFLQFSAELLRMALGGVAAIGFLVSLLAGKGSLPATIFRPPIYISLSASIAAFALAGGAALMHRFLAADGMFYHFRALKYLIVCEDLAQQGNSTKRSLVLRAAHHDEIARNRKFQTSERMLFISGLLLFAGVALFGAAVALVLVDGPIFDATQAPYGPEGRLIPPQHDNRGGKMPISYNAPGNERSPAKGSPGREMRRN